jgi:hypothetical protein
MRLRLLSAIVFLTVIPLALRAQDESSNGAQSNAQPNVQAAPPQRSAPAPPDTGRVTGTIFCNDTHRPARGAIALAQPLAEGAKTRPASGMHMVRVAMDGTYTIEHLHPGNYAVIGMLPGYLSVLDDLPIGQMDTDKDPSASNAVLARNGTVAVRNNETSNFDLMLQRGASVSGRVLYSDGSPATQIQISVDDVNAKPLSSAEGMQAMFANVNAGSFMRSFLLHQGTGTDDQGNFRISGLKPGTYRVAATEPAQNAAGGDEGGTMFFTGMFSDPKALHIYSGDTFHRNAAKTYQLRAGDDLTGIDITIPTDAFHRVEGRLSTLGGTPVPVAAIKLTDTSDDSFVLSTTPARDGSFVFAAVPSGTYKLSATGARIGTLPDVFPDGIPIEAGMLKDSHALADGTTGVIVKDSDVSEVSLQLTDAPPSPAPGQTPGTAAAAPQ